MTGLYSAFPERQCDNKDQHDAHPWNKVIKGDGIDYWFCQGRPALMAKCNECTGVAIKQDDTPREGTVWAETRTPGHDVIINRPVTQSQPPDELHILSVRRITDQDRQRTIDRLNQAYVLGALTLDERDLRVATALQAVSQNGLDRLEKDLPVEVVPAKDLTVREISKIAPVPVSSKPASRPKGSILPPAGFMITGGAITFFNGLAYIITGIGVFGPIALIFAALMFLLIWLW